MADGGVATLPRTEAPGGTSLKRFARRRSTIAFLMTLPLIATCVTANIAARWLGGQPIYEQLLERTLKQAGVHPERMPHRPESELG